MCDWRQNWIKYQVDSNIGKNYKDSGQVRVQGQIKNAQPNSKIIFWAANPPDYRTSYSGSALPYPNHDMAYESSPSSGVVDVQSNGRFEINLRYPSGYYSGLGTVYVKPHVQFVVKNGNQISALQKIKIGEGIPFRLLTYPPIPETAPRCSPDFYRGAESLPVRTQEFILRDSSYPAKNQMPANFWGLTPPH